MANSAFELTSVAGAILQVQQTTFSTTFTTTSTSLTDLTGLSVSITPTSTANKVLVTYTICVGTSTSLGLIQLVRGSTAIATGASAGSRSVGTSALNNNTSIGVESSTMCFLDSPATTSATTYKLQGFIQTSGTLAINRSVVDSNSAGYPRTFSSITVMEVAV